MNHQNGGLLVQVFKDTNCAPRVDVTVRENYVGHTGVDATMDNVDAVRVNISTVDVETTMEKYAHFRICLDYVCLNYLHVIENGFACLELELQWETVAEGLSR